MSTNLYHRIGKFTNELILEEIAEEKNLFIVKDEFIYKDSYGHTWKAHAGEKIEGSSLPQIAWKLFGSPFKSKFLEAFVIFEAACNHREYPWEITHEVLYEAALSCEVEEKAAKILFASVYYFGQHWPSKFEKDKINFDIIKQSRFTLDDFFELKNLIETKNLSLQEIMDYEPQHMHKSLELH